MSVALLIVIIYMGVLVAVSWVSAVFQRGKTSQSFLFASHQLPWALVGVMIAGIAVGGSSTVGVAQNAYTAGISAGWYNVAWAMGPIFTGLFIAKGVRRSKYSTINQMLGAVFGDYFELCSAIIQMAIMTVIVSLQIIAGGAILTALMPEVFTMPSGLLVSAVMFGLVAALGGLLAASLCNVINLAVIYLGLIFGVIAAANQYGGFSAINAALPAGLSGDGSHWYHLTNGMGLTVICAWFLTMLIQGIPSGAIMQNFVAAKSPEDASKGAFFSAVVMIPGGFLAALLGIVAAVHAPGLENSALALPSVVMTLPGWIAGILLAGLWAADISTATGLMVAVSTMGTEDVLFKYFIRSKSRRLRMRLTRLTVVAVVLIAYLAATQIGNILGSLMVALALYAPYAVLLSAMFLAPKLVRRSSGWVTFSFGTVAFIVAQFIEPAWRLGGQTVFTALVVSLIGFALSILDRRPAPVDRLYGEGVGAVEENDNGDIISTGENI